MLTCPSDWWREADAGLEGKHSVSCAPEEKHCQQHTMGVMLLMSPTGYSQCPMIPFWLKVPFPAARTGAETWGGLGAMWKAGREQGRDRCEPEQLSVARYHRYARYTLVDCSLHDFVFLLLPNFWHLSDSLQGSLASLLLEFRVHPPLLPSFTLSATFPTLPQAADTQIPARAFVFSTY